jgi:hypothetical protein
MRGPEAARGGQGSGGPVSGPDGMRGGPRGFGGFAGGPMRGPDFGGGRPFGPRDGAGGPRDGRDGGPGRDGARRDGGPDGGMPNVVARLEQIERRLDAIIRQISNERREPPPR